MISIKKIAIIIIIAFVSLEIGIPILNNIIDTNYTKPSDYIKNWFESKGILLDYNPDIIINDIEFSLYDTINEKYVPSPPNPYYYYNADRNIHMYEYELLQNGGSPTLSYSGFLDINITIPKPFIGEYYLVAGTYKIFAGNYIIDADTHDYMGGFNLYEEYKNPQNVVFMAEPDYLIIQKGVGSNNYQIAYTTNVFKDYTHHAGIYGEWYDKDGDLNNYFHTKYIYYITRVQLVNANNFILDEVVLLTKWYTLPYQ